VSIHVTAAASGTLNSARLAARQLPIPVRLVDSGTAGFGVSCCVWAAGEAISRGANIDEVVRAAESLMPRIGAVFMVGELDFFQKGSGHSSGVPVMTVNDGRVDVVARVSTASEAVEALASTAIGWGPRLNVAIGLADRSGEELVGALARVMGASPKVLEVVRYRIGPSVGAYAGLGTVGCFMFPAL
jgi:fatty acid-binding protein DegV